MTYYLGGIGTGILIMIGIQWWNIGRHKRIRSLTKYVVFSIAAVLVFTGISIFYQWSTGQELSSTLTTCFMSTFGGEVLFCALLKIFKIKEENKDE